MTLAPYVGIPYRDRGRDATGVDCWGLVCLVYRQALGIELPSFADRYAALDTREAEDLARLVQAEHALFAPLGIDPLRPSQPISRPQCYDLVLLRIGGIPCHVGICTGDGRMLHVQRGTTSWIEALDRPSWVNRIAGYYQYAG